MGLGWRQGHSVEHRVDGVLMPCIPDGQRVFHLGPVWRQKEFLGHLMGGGPGCSLKPGGAWMYFVEPWMEGGHPIWNVDGGRLYFQGPECTEGLFTDSGWRAGVISGLHMESRGIYWS